jgi:hypothetical protein
MTSETIELPPGGPQHDSPRHDPPSSSGASGELTSSNDELSRLLSELATKPDRLLGPYSTEEPSSAQPPPPAPEVPVAKLEPEEQEPESFDAVAALNAFLSATPVVPVTASTAPPAIAAEPLLTSLDSSPEIPSLPEPPLVDVAAAASSPGSFKAFPALDPGAPISHAARAESPKEAEPEGEDEEYDENESPRGASWPFILLLSYASAVTIGLIWVLWGGLKIRESEEEDFPAASTAPDPGRRADQSRKVASPPSIASDHRTTLGKPLRMSLLEATPLGISWGKVRLQRSFDSVQDRDGGDNALRLKLRLENVSTDAIFFPLDEAFLRENERGQLDSSIETSDGLQIKMFPLAVASEWSIVGQEFRELKPGQSYETEVVSAPDVPGRVTPEMTWRLRLRTGINQTDTMGVRFREDQIH